MPDAAAPFNRTSIPAPQLAEPLLEMLRAMKKQPAPFEPQYFDYTVHTAARNLLIEAGLHDNATDKMSSDAAKKFSVVINDGGSSRMTAYVLPRDGDHRHALQDITTHDPVHLLPDIQAWRDRFLTPPVAMDDPKATAAVEPH